MVGLTILAVLLFWIVLSLGITWLIMKKLPLKRFKFIAALPLFVIVFLIPVADELLARPQFEALCRKGNVIRIDAQKIKGKTVRLEIQPFNQEIEGAIIPILHSHYSYRDVATDEEFAWYDVYEARGGLMAQWVGFPEGRNPWTISHPSCSPSRHSHQIAKDFGFTLIN
jgi:hypothetical protein